MVVNSNASHDALGRFLVTTQIIIGAEFLTATIASNLGFCMFTQNVPLHVRCLRRIAANIAKCHFAIIIMRTRHVCAERWSLVQWHLHWRASRIGCHGMEIGWARRDG